MAKFFALVSNELQTALRHPNREIIPVLFFGVLSYIGLQFGLSVQFSTIQSTETTTWFLPGLVMFVLMFTAYQHANSKILDKNNSGYLTHLRSNATSPWLYILAFIGDAVVISLLKALIVVVIFAILVPEIGGLLAWLGIFGIGLIAGIFWAGAGIILGLLRKEYHASGQIFSLIVIPLLVITGFVVPVAVYPHQIELITLLIPSTYGFEMSRALIGIGNFQGWMFAALFGWAAVAVSIAVYVLHTEDRR